MDAVLNEFDEGKEVLGDQKIPDRRQLLANRIRIDAVSCLLQRRENHSCRQRAARGVRADASPNLNAEIMALQFERAQFEPEVQVQSEFAPGATLVHGLSKLSQKIFIFLWGLF